MPWSHGAPYSPIAQTALNISSTANLLVGGYSASAGLPSGALLDEFRIYNRALSADEVAATWNIELVSSLSKAVSPTSTEPGAPITYTLNLTNPYTETVTGVLITDTIPAEITNLEVISSGIDIVDLPGTPYAWEVPSMAAAQSGVITVTGVLTSPLAAGTITNTVTAEVSGTLFTAQAPLEVLNAAPVADAGDDKGVAAGDEVTLDGSGSSDANGEALTYDWTQSGGPSVSLSDTTAVSPTFTMPLTATETLTFTLVVTDTTDTASALDNVAVSIRSGSADLAVANSARVHGLHGITYTIVATNNGPDDAAGAVISDTVPAGVTGVTWTSEAAGGAAGTASGSGNLDDTLTAFPSGGVITYTLAGTLGTWSGVSNTAEITIPSGMEDTDTSNNSVTIQTYVLDVPLIWR